MHQNTSFQVKKIIFFWGGSPDGYGCPIPKSSPRHLLSIKPAGSAVQIPLLMTVCAGQDVDVGQQANSKRFMRFGRQRQRQRLISADDDVEQMSNDKRFMRFGREFMRFGRDDRRKRHSNERTFLISLPLMLIRMLLKESVE